LYTAGSRLNLLPILAFKIAFLIDFSMEALFRTVVPANPQHPLTKNPYSPKQQNHNLNPRCFEYSFFEINNLFICGSETYIRIGYSGISNLLIIS